MSRRRGEFEHRTSIFEGAFRAWSHLGGLPPEDVEARPTTDLDPLANPLQNDPRLANQRKNGDIKETKNPDGTPRQEYPYEPLPRSGLAHPYVQAILSPWLGPDADNEAIQLGLTTLRTWWQHRRKGESGSAIAALGTEKMKGVVEGYTRHFFTLAHCLILNDKEQPPRTLHGRMKELEKARNKKNKKGKMGGEGDSVKGSLNSSMNSQDLVSDIKGDLTDSNLSPLERLHAAQRRQLASSGMIHPQMPASTQVDISNPDPPVNLKGQCIPGKLDLPSVVEQVNHAANQLAHRGGSGVVPMTSSSGGPGGAPMNQYGDPDRTPIVFLSGRGDLMVAMEIDGITCAHCVKIVETVLKGCSGNKSPIEGLLDAAADQTLNAVLIKIDSPANAKRVAFESARNLSMVGYTAKVKELSLVGPNGEKRSPSDVASAFEVVGNSSSTDVFDWALPCTCPDNGVMRNDCTRHGQMSGRIFEAFEAREKQVTEYLSSGRVERTPASMVGGGGNSDALDHNEEAQILAAAAQMQPQQTRMQSQTQMQPHPQMQPQQAQAAGVSNGGLGGMEDDEPIQIEQKMDFFGFEPPNGNGGNNPMRHHQRQRHHHQQHPAPPQMQDMVEPIQHHAGMGGDELGDLGGVSPRRASQRNPSVISYGGLRHMSMNSETTFGRAMSGLSALSIDWENLEDFDLDVDHSAHINANSPSKMGGAGGDHGNSNGGRRSSIRRPQHHPAAANNGDQEAHVSFKV